MTEERWSSDRMFLLAVIGGAVGLGNIWRFPYVVGENGGGVFVLSLTGSDVRFNGSEFYENTANQGGGIASLTSDDSLVLQHFNDGVV